MNVLLIDNYDSFSYNIVELLRCVGNHDLSIRFNNKISVEEASTFDKIILSPGPGIPSEAGEIIPIIQALAPTHSILGICLGHQAIADAFGGTLRNEIKPYHGFRTTTSIIKPHSLFKTLPTSFQVGLYHSWTVDDEFLPTELQITSRSTENNIMSISHKRYDIHGVQFHPESYMTEYGKELMSNYIHTNNHE